MDVCYPELNAAPDKEETDLPFDIGDLPPDIRSKIDAIIRNNQDLDAQIDAIDALLFGRREPIDADNESGIDVESNGSNSASIASSSEYSVVGAGCVSVSAAVCSDPFRQPPATTTTTASLPLRVGSVSDQHNVQLVLPPPPEFFQESNDVQELAEFHLDGGFELPPPIEFTPSFVLPTVIELPEDDHRSSDSLWIPTPDYDASAASEDCIPPPLGFDTELPSTGSSSSVSNGLPKSSNSNNSPNHSALVASRTPSSNQQNRLLSVPPIIAPKPLLIKHGSADGFSEKDNVSDAGVLVTTGSLLSISEQQIMRSVVKEMTEQNRSNLVAVAAANGLGAVTGGECERLPPPVSPVSVGVPAGHVVSVTSSRAVRGEASVVPSNVSPTSIPRRFQGITETQKKETVVEPKKKHNFLQKWLRRGSSTTSTVDIVENTVSATPSDDTHIIGHTISTKRNSTKPSESGISDVATATSTMPRSIGQTKAKPSTGTNRLSVQIPETTAVAPRGENRLSLNVDSIHKSSSAQSFPLSNPASPTNGSVVLEPQLSFSRLKPDENSLVNIDDMQWSSDEEDSSNKTRDDFSSDEATTSDEDELTFLKKLKVRPQLRDQTGRLTIGPSIGASRLKATSMMMLNQAGSGSTIGPTTVSRTTDDIASRPVMKNIESGIMTLQRYKKKKTNKQSVVSLGFGTVGKSPKFGRPPVTDSSSMAQTGANTDEDDVIGLRRSDYLPSSSTTTSGTHTTTTSSAAASIRLPSVLTDLRRSYDLSSSMETDTTSFPSTSPLPQTNSFSNSIIGVQKQASQFGGGERGSSAEENKFNTFRGAMRPIRWSEDQSEPVVMRHSGINTISGFGGVSKIKQRMSVPPEWITVKSPETKETAEPPPLHCNEDRTKTITTATKPPVRPRPKTLIHPCGDASQLWKNVENVQIPVPRFEQRVQPAVSTGEIETTRPHDVGNDNFPAITPQQSSFDAQDNIDIRRLTLPPEDDSIPPPMEFLSSDDSTQVEILIVPPPCGPYSDNLVIAEPPSIQANLTAVKAMTSESITVKTYSNRPVHEAIVDNRSILGDLDLTKSLLLGNVSVDAVPLTGSVTSTDPTLPAIVRQFVTDSKNFVAVASACTNSGVTDVNIQLHPVTESAMRRLAAMSVACRRLTVTSLTSRGGHLTVPLPTVVAVVDYTIDVATVFGDMLDAARLAVDSRSDAGRRFAVDSLNGHAVSLARALVGFVQRTRTM